MMKIYITIMEFLPIQTTVFQKGEDLFAFFCEHIKENKITLEENSVCILSSKLVALAQNRKVAVPNNFFFEDLVRKHSEKIFSKTKIFFLTKAQGIVIPNAGIDRSNTQKNTAILWPKDPQNFADIFQEKLQEKFFLKNIAVIISDSRITPMRRGTVGVALAWAGIQGVCDLRGEKDIYGNTLQVSMVNISDNVVSGAEILMGQGSECIPFVVCKNFPHKFFTDISQNPHDAFIPEEEDLFSVFS